MRILLAIEDAAGTQLLRRLLGGPDEIVAVVARPQDEGATGSAWAAAHAAGVTRWAAGRLTSSELPDELRAAGVDVLINVYSLVIVPEAVLRALPLGGWNLHPAPLPRYAGLHSVSWAIYHGEAEHGVTVHRMAPTVDLGEIAYQVRFPVAPDESALSVATRCVTQGLPLVEQLVAQLREDPAGVPALAQDRTRRTFFGLGPPDHGRMPWAGPARRVLDLVRACDYGPLPSPWGHPTAILQGGSIEVVRLSPTHRVADQPPGTVLVEDGAIHVACLDQYVRLDRIRVEGRTMEPASILHPGDRFDA